MNHRWHRVKVQTKRAWNKLKNTGSYIRSLQLVEKVKTRTKLAWSKLKKSPRLESMKVGGWNAAKAIALLVGFIALAIWLERMTSEAVNRLKSIPLSYLWWGLGIVSGVALIIGLLWNPARRGYTGRAMRSRWLWWPMVILLLVAIGIGAYEKYGYFSQPKAPATSSSLPRLSAEVALPIIAQCESGGRQFEADGKTPLRNREGSSAIGKYQIMASLHDERAKSMGVDIRTEAGNEAYAKFLYAESGTLHWEAESRSKTCWESQLMAKATALGLTASTTTVPPTTDSTFVVKVRPGQPAEVVMPPNWMIVWWGDKAKFTSHAEKRGEDKVRIFATRTGVGSAEIKIHRYYDPDPNWWRRR